MTLPHPTSYQGSKHKLAPAISLYLPPEIETFYGPFAGSVAMSIYATHYRWADRFVIANTSDPMIALLRAIVAEPENTAARYRDLWMGQMNGDDGYFNRIRDRYNEAGDHVDLLYLICRCVKNSIRFNRRGRFTQSVDKRRLGMRPKKMQAAILGVSTILRHRVEFRLGGWLESTAAAVRNKKYLRTAGTRGHGRIQWNGLRTKDFSEAMSGESLFKIIANPSQIRS